MPKGDNFKGKKPTNKPGHRTTEGEILERVAQIAKLQIQGYQRFEIIPIFKSKYGLSTSQIDDYIAEAKKRIKAKNDEEIGDEAEIVKARITDTYQGARKDKKWDACTRAIKLHMELKGLEAPKRIDITKRVSLKESELDKYDELGLPGLAEEEKDILKDITGLEE